MCDIGCAALAGCLARAPCHPLDTLKSVALVSHDASLAAAARTVYTREGLAGFYRGIGVACVGSAPGVAIYIGTYGAAKSVVEPAANSRGLPSAVSHLGCGLIAESVSCVFWVPIDVVKERLQVQGPDVKGRYQSSWDAVKSVAHREGLRGLYKGYFVTLSSFGPFSAIYFAAYEGFLARFPKPANAQDAAGNGLAGVVCGFLGNAVACAFTNPLEMVKTRLQVQRAMLVADGDGGRAAAAPSRQFAYAYTGMLDGLRSIAREEGPLAGWRGLGSRIAYTAPNAALTFGLYNALKAKFCSRPAAS